MSVRTEVVSIEQPAPSLYNDVEFKPVIDGTKYEGHVLTPPGCPLKRGDQVNIVRYLEFDPSSRYSDSLGKGIEIIAISCLAHAECNIPYCFISSRIPEAPKNT